MLLLDALVGNPSRNLSNIKVKREYGIWQLQPISDFEKSLLTTVDEVDLMVYDIQDVVFDKTDLITEHYLSDEERNSSDYNTLSTLQGYHNHVVKLINHTRIGKVLRLELAPKTEDDFIEQVKEQCKEELDYLNTHTDLHDNILEYLKYRYDLYIKQFTTNY